MTADHTGPSEILALDVKAGTWLRMHTETYATVMARSWPTVHHYAQRKVVWFPPISDPAVLMEGMLRHDVDYVVVINRESSYYLPDDGHCFDSLLANYGDKFRLILQRHNLRIFSLTGMNWLVQPHNSVSHQFEQMEVIFDDVASLAIIMMSCREGLVFAVVVAASFMACCTRCLRTDGWCMTSNPDVIGETRRLHQLLPHGHYDQGSTGEMAMLRQLRVSELPTDGKLR
jgi:hypothetical protein